jgi:tripartite-type tricarboxylate transporter receptor subunit TctC
MTRVRGLSTSMRRVLFWCLAWLLLCSQAAYSQGYPDPSRPIRIVVPFGAGGGVDLLARGYAKAMQEVAGVNTVVDNRPGAEAVIGVQAFLAAPPDGYTVLITSSSAVTFGPVSIANIPYDPVKDFVPLIALGRTPFLMTLGSSTPFRSAGEFIAAAKAAPGRYTCASASTSTRMACELLQATAGIRLLNVPYKSAGAAMVAVAAGEADTYITDPGSATALLAAGRARAVAVTTADRSPTMASLPTLREEGVEAYRLAVWFGAYMPANTPPEVAAAMRDILRRAMETQAVKEMLWNASIEAIEVSGPALTELARTEIDMWTKLIRTANIKLN